MDPAEKCVESAKQRAFRGSVRLESCGLEDLSAPAGSFDAVVFVASLHHMEAEAALRKAARLLNKGGVLLVVGLSRPSGPGDRLLEGLRVLPSWVLSRLHRAQSSEELGIPVSYALPPMGEVRSLVRRLLPGAKLRQGLYYRYLLKWVKA
jgi:ubiquinone/menaquinone biosynthesis C-methylase UbiE